MDRFKLFMIRRATLLIAMMAVIIAIISVVVQYRAGTILAYGDAESHINISKRIIGGLTPGFGQLGGVWLPLHHLLMVPFVASDFMWRSGLGGAVVSAVCFVIAATFVYLLTTLLTGNRLAGLIGFIVFAANPNIFYMLATPMSELPLAAFMTGSMYFFIKWVLRRGMYDLILASGLVLLASLTRYDAWFLVFIECIGILIIALREKWTFKKLEGISILFLTLAVFGIILWLLWSAVIFHDPFYFMNSPYSAKSQQLAFLQSGELPSYHNLIQSLALYGGATVWNIGLAICSLMVAGLLAYVFFDRSKFSIKTIVILLLASPFIFNVLSLVLGISILFVPGVTPDSFRYHLFNIRYGLQMVPAAAVLAGLLVNAVRLRWARIATGAAVVICAGLFAFTFPITLQDGLHGLSARFPNGVSGINAVFGQYYDHGRVAFDDFSRSANPISLGVPMNSIIYVGSHPYWEDMIAHPNENARWIVIRKDDALYRAFYGNATFAQDYSAVYVQGDTTLYKCTNDCHGYAQ